MDVQKLVGSSGCCQDGGETYGRELYPLTFLWVAPKSVENKERSRQETVNFYLFIYFWLRWVFVAARGLSLVAASGGYSSLQCAGFSLRWLLLLQSTGSGHAGFSSCGTWAQELWLVGSRAQAQ